MNGEGSILESVSFHFFCDTLKSKVLREWSRVVKATKKIALPLLEEEVIQNNIELDLKYSLRQSAKYLLDDVELKTGQFFDLISERNDLELSTDLSGTEGNISKEERKAEERKRIESLLSVGRKQKRTTLIDLRRHFKTKEFVRRWNYIRLRKHIRAWKRHIDNKMSLANKFFILKFAPRVLKLWRKHILYYQTTKKSPKRGGYLEIYLKKKSSNDVSELLDDTPLSKGSLKRAGKKELTKLNNKKKKEMIGRKFKRRNDMYHHSHGSEDDKFRQQKQATKTHRQTLMCNRRKVGKGDITNANTTLSPQPRQMTIPMPSKHPSRV